MTTLLCPDCGRLISTAFPMHTCEPTRSHILAALQRCKEAHGRCWRQALRLAWFDGDYGVLDDVSDTLQWLRNSDHPLRKLPHGII